MSRYSKLITAAAAVFMAVAAQSCFTGVEHTGHIGLSRSERKVVKATAEEQFDASLSLELPSAWTPGRKLYAPADSRVGLIFTPRLSADEAPAADTLTFIGISVVPHSDGKGRKAIEFEHKGNRLVYVSNRTAADPDSLLLPPPMLIDLQMVSKLNGELRGKTLWTRTPQRYDENDTLISGLRYEPVTVNAVTAGDVMFPVRITFTDSKGQTASVLMGVDTRGTSRAFHNLFFMSDPRRLYPNTDDDTWRLIQASNIRQGMTKEECRLALGPPTDVSSGHDRNNTLDVWQYSDGVYLMFEDGRLLRYRK